MSSTRLHSNVVVVVPAVDDGVAHADGDFIAKVKVPNALLDAGHTGKLESISVIDNALQNSAMDVLVFGDEPTVTSAANTALDISDANIKAAKFLGKVSIAATDFLGTTSNGIATIRNLGLILEGLKKREEGKNEPSDKDLWLVLVSRGTPNYAAVNDLTLYIGITQD